MQRLPTRMWRMLAGVLIPTAALLVATPAFADRDDHRRWHHREWRDHDRHHGHHWRHGKGHGHKHWHKHRHSDRVVIVRPPPRVIYREPPRVYYVEPPRYRYYEPVPGVSGSVTFRF